MRFFVVIFAAILFFSTTAKAAVTVEEYVLYQGIYENPHCKYEGKNIERDFNFCKCNVDIRYPQIKGLADSRFQAEINNRFLQMAKRNAYYSEDAQIQKMIKVSEVKKPNEWIASSEFNYKTTFQSSGLLAFEFSYGNYSGGAHGMGGNRGVIIDLEKGKILSLNELFADKDMASINQTIYEQLSKLPRVTGDSVFESMHGKFIKDGKCKGCTLLLTQDGIKVVFQSYVVGPYAAGMPEALIPIQYISYPAIVAALKEQKPAAPEKK